jgi:Asp-tRNA(Asn)/Glu-tRNA(Gln) amidotransferase A subunit family amidase
MEGETWGFGWPALTELGGVPSVVPVGQLPKNGGPLSVALFGHSRSDQRLLTVAERLASQAQVCIKITCKMQSVKSGCLCPACWQTIVGSH